jgi:ribonuclease BN (tRNA processing enzyme)
MKLSKSENDLFTAERNDYRLLLDQINSPKRSKSNGFSITTIGNAGGSDSTSKGFNCGGMLIRFKDRRIIVDPGANSLSFLTSVGFDTYSITDVLATHVHNDHVGDISVAISSALQLNLNPDQNKNKNILVSPSLVDYGNPGATCFGFTLPKYSWNGNVKVLYWKDIKTIRYDGITLDSVRSANLGDLVNVKSVEARHSGIPSSGFVFSTPFGKFAYTGDTEFFPQLVDQYADADVLWLNLNTLGLNSMTDYNSDVPVNNEPVKNHLGYVGVCQLIDSVKPKVAIVAHFGSQLSTKVEDIQRVLRKRFSGQKTFIYCPQTGDEFVFENSFNQQPEVREFTL